MSETAVALKPQRSLTALDQFFVSCMWLAYNVQWGALLAVVLPAQIQAMVGSAAKEQTLGAIAPAGAVVALILPAVSGAISDRSRSRFGRRRPFLVTGVILDILFLMLMAGFGQGSSVWLFALCYMGLQFGCNWFGG